MVGGQDKLVFDGASFALDASASSRVSDTHVQGSVRRSSPSMATRCRARGGGRCLRCAVPTPHVTKNGFPGVLLGLSGGIDWAHSGDCRRCARRGKGACGDDAIAKCAGVSRECAWEPKRSCALFGNCHQADVRCIHDGTRRRSWQGLAPDHRGKSAVAHTRNPLDGHVQQVKLPSCSPRATRVKWARIRDAVRRHGGRVRVLKDISKMLVYPSATIATAVSPVISERVITRGRCRPGPDRPGQPAPGTTCSTASWKPMSSTTKGCAKSKRTAIAAKTSSASSGGSRMQAQPGANRHSE